ncbi:MAG: MerR family transcriptional regulator [Roseiflexaceae bacterium]
MDHELSIQQAALQTGLSVHTLRYYERIGLMDPIGRAASGHRRYTESDLEWIILLTRLRTTDMPIAEMQRFAQLVRQGEGTIAERLVVLEAHQRKLCQQLHAIQLTLVVLDEKVAHYRAYKNAQLSESVENN